MPRDALQAQAERRDARVADAMFLLRFPVTFEKHTQRRVNLSAARRRLATRNHTLTPVGDPDECTASYCNVEPMMAGYCTKPPVRHPAHRSR